MSKEQLKAFVEMVKSDAELQEKFIASATPEAAIEMAKTAGFLITIQDIQSVMSQSDEELTDQDLEAAGGGLFGDTAGWFASPIRVITVSNLSENRGMKFDGQRCRERS